MKVRLPRLRQPRCKIRYDTQRERPNIYRVALYRIKQKRLERIAGAVPCGSMWGVCRSKENDFRSIEPEQSRRVDAAPCADCVSLDAPPRLLARVRLSRKERAGPTAPTPPAEETDS